MTTTEAVRPLLPVIEPNDGHPYVAGSRCKACGHTYVGTRDVCAKCTARDAMEHVQLAETGKVWAWTVVHRSFPGVATPFVDVIVDLDDGAHIKGTLVDVEPDAVTPDMPVRMVFREVIPAGADKPYLTYLFVPAQGAAA
ncbi:Zn-ribbon domain-containing OB-fold protein [Novosphingobium olei]|uniref:Zn-ribbon domain-containing OB-fold protein n=1 Tax=Novosphingobium olei TaxID=2728851 RepID=A0A7Y0BLS5_9SPHN|nr:Zn-ribbon domain-containing OB-fold protein [Novosphingobium olei]NML92685.1 Zn-ribbon domain-containing OB-fold protein [Novosphingobium olei]